MAGTQSRRPHAMSRGERAPTEMVVPEAAMGKAVAAKMKAAAAEVEAMAAKVEAAKVATTKMSTTEMAAAVSSAPSRLRVRPDAEAQHRSKYGDTYANSAM
jgi:hypothetical protein